MLQVSEVTIYSVDMDEEFLDVEGEVVFDNNLSSVFSVQYCYEEEAFTSCEFEINVGEYDKNDFKLSVLRHAEAFEE